uniref:CKLF like MARVEL transmembrane domain containing 3 n=1 Tax=Taeniopygia guttata TaxID=59729 RepID=A0A674GLU4_TAEGU
MLERSPRHSDPEIPALSGFGLGDLQRPVPSPAPGGSLCSGWQGGQEVPVQQHSTGQGQGGSRFHCPWPGAGGGRWGRPPQLGMLNLFFFSRFRSVTISASLLQRGKKKNSTANPLPRACSRARLELSPISARARPSPAQPGPARAHPARAAAMEDPEPAGAAPAPGLSSLLPSRELLRSRKGQLLLAESVLSFIIFICYIASLAASFMMAPLLEFLLALFLFFAYASKLNEKFKGVHWPLAVFGFAATIVFAVDFYITFNDLVTFLKQGSSDSPEGRKTEDEDSDSDSD